MRRIAFSFLLLAIVAFAAVAKEKKPTKPEDLMNPLLSPRLALWLLGPVSRLATEVEIKRYVALRADDEAQAFIAEFWARRDPDPQYEGNSLLERFDERLREADKKFAEAGVPGRQTDRGITYVLYGPPAAERFDIAEHPDDPAVLIWSYPADAPKGLDGKAPERQIRFIKRGDLTQFFKPNLKPAKPRFGLSDPP